MSRLDRLLSELERARKRLEEPQGRIARRNGRRAFLATLRKLRDRVDQEYPNIRKPPKSRKKGKTKAIPTGYVRLSDYRYERSQVDMLEAIAEANTPLKRVAGEAYVPKWVLAVGPVVSKLRETKKSKKLQQAAVAAAHLKGLTL